jgi:hypothetical protein
LAGVARGRPGAVGVPGGGPSMGPRRRTLRSARPVKNPRTKSYVPRSPSTSRLARQIRHSKTASSTESNALNGCSTAGKERESTVPWTAVYPPRHHKRPRQTASTQPTIVATRTQTRTLRLRLVISRSAARTRSPSARHGAATPTASQGPQQAEVPGRLPHHRPHCAAAALQTRSGL